VAWAGNGCAAAIEQLVGRYEIQIFRLARNITGNHEDAEQVAQNAFFKPFLNFAWVCIVELFARSQALFPRSNRFLMGGVEEASTLQTHNTSRLRFRDDPLHFAEFIRFGEYDSLGTAIASIQLRKLHIG
jgi:hypothetical protein